jgi:hypothetical protein
MHSFYMYATRAQKRSQSDPPTQWDRRIWQSLGLAQCCQQLRSEYRPLWIRNFAVRLRPHNFSEFVLTFFPPTTQEQKHGPELIQISWEHGVDNVCSQQDIMPFLLLHARFPNVRFQHVPYRVADLEQGPDEQVCDHCREEMYLEEHGHDPVDADGECNCYNEFITPKEWLMEAECEMIYTENLEDLLHNKNDKWLADLLAGEMTVKCTYDRNTDLPTFRILRKTPIGKWGADCEGVYNLLKEWGIFELSCKRPWSLSLCSGRKAKQRLATTTLPRRCCGRFVCPDQVFSMSFGLHRQRS